MYYNMNDIDIKSSNNLLRKVFLYMILGIAISFGTGAYLLYFNQGLLYTLLDYYQFLVIAELAMVFSISFFINKISAGLARILFLAYSLVNGITLTVIGLIYAFLCFYDNSYNLYCNCYLWLYYTRRSKFL